jgi:RimJ/RimL family protein N-acetyltransferase
MSAAGSSQGANYSPSRGSEAAIAASAGVPSRARFIDPVTLSGTHAALEPLAREHEAAIRQAAADGELWTLWYTSVPAPDKTTAWLDIALDMRERLGAMPFVVRDKASGDIVGSTRYFNVDAANRRLEIGHTWYARRAQRTAINTECKLLLLTHAFETLQCIAVEFRTHWFNHRSREAILRLGAKQDGVLRNHQVLPDGSKRDTVVFSIIDNEWPAVKAHLRSLLERPGAGQP